MAIRYVWSGSSTPTAPYLDSQGWDQAAHSLADVDASVSAGDIVLCHYTHDNGGYGSNTDLSFAGNNRIISVDKDDSNKYRAGAKDLVTAASGYMRVYATHGKSLSVEGLEIGSTGGYFSPSYAHQGAVVTYRNCTIHGNYSVAGSLYINSGGSLTSFINCTIDVHSVAGPLVYIYSADEMEFIGCSFTNASSVTSLVNCRYFTLSGAARFSDTDVSAFGTILNAGNVCYQVILKRCKLASTLTYINGGGPATQVTAYNCGSNTNLTTPPFGLTKYARGTSGTIEHDTVYLNASDSVNQYSLKYSTLSTIAVHNPLELPTPLAIWHDASGSKTLTIEMNSGDSGLTDEDVYALVSFGDETSNPDTTYKGTFVDTRPTYGNAAAAGTSTYLKTSTQSWTGGGGTDYKFEITGIAPAEPCYVYVRIGLTKNMSGTPNYLWVDPAITLT